jgi:hypothetical protein
MTYSYKITNSSHMWIIFFLRKSEIQDDHEDKLNIGPNRKNISQLFLSETVEAFVGKFGCALGSVVDKLRSPLNPINILYNASTSFSRIEDTLYL